MISSIVIKPLFVEIICLGLPISSRDICRVWSRDVELDALAMSGLSHPSKGGFVVVFLRQGWVFIIILFISSWFFWRLVTIKLRAAIDDIIWLRFWATFILFKGEFPL